MKILFWLSIGLDRRTPSEHLLTAIVQKLCEQGHCVHIIQKETGGQLPKIPEVLHDLPVTTECIHVRQAKKNNFIARYLVDVVYVLKCCSALRNCKDCGAVFNQSSNVAGLMVYALRCILPGRPVTFNVQDIFPENAVYSGSIKAGGLAYRLLAAQQRYAYRKAENIITISEDMKQQLVECGAASDKVTVVYNWSYQDEPYNPNHMEHPEIRKLFSEDKFNVVYAGNIGMMQNVDVVVEAARLMDEPDVHFHIIGDGLYKNKLLEAARGLDNISFWPMQPSSLAPNIYAMADVNVIPLAEGIYKTALPSKTATCLACQKPIIFAIGRESSFGQTAQEKTGCIVTGSNDPEGLVKAVKKCRQGYSCSTVEWFRERFLKNKNSKEYAGIIFSGITE